MTKQKINPTGKPWFPFYAAAWLGSDRVQEMTFTEKGIYIELLAMCWQYGSIPWDKTKLAKRLRIDCRVIGRFMDNYMDLTVTLQQGSTDVTFSKLQDFAVTLRKNGVDENTEQSRVEKKRAELEQLRETERVSGVLETKTKPVQASVPDGNKAPVSVQGKTLSPVSVSEEKQSPVRPRNGFDPLTFDGDIDPAPSSNYPRTETYPGEEVHRILLYHFKHNPQGYWDNPSKGNVTSDLRLSRTINAMAAQVPDEWVPPAAKVAGNRTVGDPSCRRCRGRGRVASVSGNGDRHSVPCDACTPRQQVARGRDWVDA